MTGLTLDRMRYWVRKEVVGTESQTLPTEDIDELLNFSLWNIESKFDFRTRESGVFADTIVDQFEYSLESIDRLDAITSVAIVDSDDKRRKLSRSSRDWMDSNADREIKGTPSRYLREGMRLTLHPTPDRELRIEIHFRQGVESLLEGEIDAPNLPRDWHEIVISGAVWRGHKAQRNYEAMRDAMSVTGALINMAESVEKKEEAKDSRYARLNVIHEHPEDVLGGHES